MPLGAHQMERPPVKEIRLLMPVWGRRYVSQFLDFCLPSLLSANNIPALRKKAPVVFVLLTRAEDAERVSCHPAWKALQDICAVEVHSIDDLISRSSATVITLAYARDLRARQASLGDICFFYLVSDYVVADGSLAHVYERIGKGAGAVLAGNFHAVAEEAGPLLAQKRENCVLRVSSRELVNLGLSCLHPFTAGSMVENGKSLSASSNRLFWRAGDSGLIGHFYVMHMVAIRPDVSDFLVAAPSDYAFAPELCRTGTIEKITDSDEYCVLELQRRAQNESQDSVSLEDMGQAIAKWATERHIKNAESAVLFHAEEITPRFADVVLQAQRAVDGISARLGKPKPYRHHPYWGRMLDQHFETAAEAQNLDTLEALLGYRPETSKDGKLRSGLLRRMLLGRWPHLRVWHPKWADIRLFRSVIQSCPNFASALIAGEIPYPFKHFLSRTYGTVELVTALEDRPARTLNAPYDLALLFLNKGDTIHLRELASSVAAKRVVVCIGDFASDDPGFIESETAQDLYSSAPQEMKFYAVHAAFLRLGVQNRMMRWARAAGRSEGIGRVMALVGAAGLVFPSMALNLAAACSARVNRKQDCSSLIFVMDKAS